MMGKVNCIMLIDDNEFDNFFHGRVIKKSNSEITVVSKRTASDALQYLKMLDDSVESFPDLIFLDLNMPGMNGWEFIEEYRKLNSELTQKMNIIILTTSNNPDEYNKALNLDIPCGFEIKPLTGETLNNILDKYEETS